MGSLSLLQGIFPIQGSNPGIPHCRWILYKLSHKVSPSILEWIAYPFSSGSSQPRNHLLHCRWILYQLSYQGSTSLTIWSSNRILGTYPKDLKTSVYTKTYTRIFILALLMVAQTWNWPRCLSVGEQLNKLWDIQTMEYYSMPKRNEKTCASKPWNDVCGCVQLLSRLRLFATPWTPGSSVHGIPQARILEWAAIFFSRGSFLPRDQTWISYISCICRQILNH